MTVYFAGLRGYFAGVKGAFAYLRILGARSVSP